MDKENEKKRVMVDKFAIRVVIVFENERGNDPLDQIVMTGVQSLTQHLIMIA
jgi:hypothetical protein